MYRNSRDSNNSALIGQKAEDLFVKTFKKYKHIDVIKANFNEQVNLHIDFKIIGKNHKLTVDVKAMKRTSRWQGSPQENIIWIEFSSVRSNKNNNKNDGWLYGSADVICFQCKKGFLFVSRKKLANLCEKLVGYKRDEITLENSGNKKGLYKLYSRKNRRDILTTIKKEDVMSIEHIFLEY